MPTDIGTPDETGATLIARERERQRREEKYTEDHDRDQHSSGQLAWAAACYAAPDRIFQKVDLGDQIRFDDPFPPDWHDKRYDEDGNFLLPGSQILADRIANLVRAGALIAAEIDRLQDERRP